MKRLIAHVSGNIMGVGYSSIVITLAETLDLKGYMEILTDGKAFIIAEGPVEDLERFVKAIRIDNTKIGVKEILIDYRDPTGEFNNFYKIVPSQEKRIHSDKNASETGTYHFQQAVDKMDRLEQVICTPNHKLERAELDLERQEESTNLCREETLVPESCRSVAKKTAKKAILK